MKGGDPETLSQPYGRKLYRGSTRPRHGSERHRFCKGDAFISGRQTYLTTAITGDTDDVLAIPADFLEPGISAREAHLALA